MNPKTSNHTIKLVVITGVDTQGETEGEILLDNGSPDPIVNRVKFDDYPPVKVGDQILARVFSWQCPETNSDIRTGQYIRKVDTNPEKIIGIFKTSVGGGRLIPTTKKNNKIYKVDDNTINACDGELVEAHIKKKKNRNITERVTLVRNLSYSTNTKLTSIIAIKEYGIPNEFSNVVHQEALLRANIPVENPTDLTSIPFISIDPNDAKDHDDAIYATSDADNAGGFILWIAIADVSKYILQDSALDLEAFERGNSTYFPDLVVPMIPDALSRNMCSLKEGELRAAITIKIWINSQGKKTAHRFYRCTIKNVFAISYEAAQQLLDNKEISKSDIKLKKLLKSLHAAYELLKKQTDYREPLELEFVEQEILLDKIGRVEKIRAKQQFKSHKIVEEFMKLANICAAETIQKHKLSFLYRVHEPPNFEKLLNLKTIAKSLGLNLIVGRKLTGSALNNLLKKAKKNNCVDAISMSILRTMSQAHYSPTNQGHFGLNLPSYTHFTSPIRRYSDLTIHRVLVHIHEWDKNLSLLSQVDLVKVGEHISNTERRSMLAERDTKDRYLASFLKDQVGESFYARINGLSKSGVFVKLEETSAEGLIPLSYISGDRFDLNKDKNKLIGRFSKTTLKLGANIMVQLKEANPVSGGLIFDLIEYEGEKMPQLKNLSRNIRKKRR